MDGARRRVREDRFAVLAQQEQIDVTRPGRTAPVGRFHPLTQILREICDAFVSMGFQVVEGPEVEWDHYNFEMLNIPRDHPARDMWNTLWIDHKDAEGRQSMLLRTHTSPMQARTMEKTEPPVRVVVPGKCYRYEATDATHEWHFHQVEGLAVDKGITMAHLKGTLYEFARRVFGPERNSPLPLRLLPLRRARRGHVHRLLCLPGEGTGQRLGLPRVPGSRVDRDSGRRYGASQGFGRRGLRPVGLHRFRLWHWPGPGGYAQVWHRGHPALLFQRPPLSRPVLGCLDIKRMKSLTSRPSHPTQPDSCASPGVSAL